MTCSAQNFSIINSCWDMSNDGGKYIIVLTVEKFSRLYHVLWRYKHEVVNLSPLSLWRLPMILVIFCRMDTVSTVNNSQIFGLAVGEFRANPHHSSCPIGFHIIRFFFFNVTSCFSILFGLFFFLSFSQAFSTFN